MIKKENGLKKCIDSVLEPANRFEPRSDVYLAPLDRRLEDRGIVNTSCVCGVCGCVRVYYVSYLGLILFIYIIASIVMLFKVLIFAVVGFI